MAKDCILVRIYVTSSVLTACLDVIKWTKNLVSCNGNNALHIMNVFIRVSVNFITIDYLFTAIKVYF